MAKKDPTTRELRIRQKERATEEHQAIGQAVTKDEADTHERRASKSTYLERKLAEREKSEREVAAEDDTQH
jgi:hypothetical protein